VIDDLIPTETVQASMERRQRHRDVSPAHALLFRARIDLVARLRAVEGTAAAARPLLEELVNDVDAALRLEGASRWKAWTDIRDRIAALLAVEHGAPK
jgi:hypothetical protein